MAIEPRHIMAEIKRITPDIPHDLFMKALFEHLPNCINKAIATLQCVMIEPEFNQTHRRILETSGFDVQASIRNEIQRIFNKPRK